MLVSAGVNCATMSLFICQRTNQIRVRYKPVTDSFQLKFY